MHHDRRQHRQHLHHPADIALHEGELAGDDSGEEVVVQGMIVWRVVDAQKLAERVDFSIDLRHGRDNATVGAIFSASVNR